MTSEQTLLSLLSSYKYHSKAYPFASQHDDTNPRQTNLSSMSHHNEVADRTVSSQSIRKKPARCCSGTNATRTKQKAASNPIPMPFSCRQVGSHWLLAGFAFHCISRIHYLPLPLLHSVCLVKSITSWRCFAHCDRFHSVLAEAGRSVRVPNEAFTLPICMATLLEAVGTPPQPRRFIRV